MSGTGQRRCLLYSHDSFGLGHLRRSLSIAEALVRLERDVQVVLATGSPYPCLFEIPERVEIVKLPSITKDAAGSYVARSLELPVADLVRQRSAILLSVAETFAPDVFLVDHTPAGPEGELLPVLRALRARLPRARPVLGLRDVIDEPERARRQLSAPGPLEALRHYYERILVYGDRRIFDAAEGYALPADVAQKLEYVGLVCPPAQAVLAARRPGPKRILASAGGGEDGFPLLSRVIRAVRGPLAGDDLELLAVTGPLMPAAEVAVLKREAEGDPRITLRERVRTLLPAVLRADLVVSMGGYNSVYETLRFGRRMIVMPRVTPRREQWERARRLERLGLVRVMPPLNGGPAGLAAVILEELAERTGPRPDLPFDGAETAARRLLALAAAARGDCRSPGPSRGAEGGS